MTRRGRFTNRRERAEKIWFDTQEYRLSTTADFTEFRDQMLATVDDLYGVSDEWSLTNLALNAVGIWSSDIEGCQTSSEGDVSVVKFQVNNEDRHYIFYKKFGENTLRFRYSQNESYLGACDWSPEQPSLANTDQPPSAVIYNGLLWVFFRTPSTNRINYKFMDANGNWSGLSDISVAGRFTGHKPSATVFDDKIYVFYKGNGNQNLYDSIYDKNLPPATRWSNEIQVKATPPTCVISPLSDVSPAVVSYDNKLWLFYKTVSVGSLASSVKYSTKSASASCFTTPAILQDKDNVTIETSSTPSVATYKNRLHLINSVLDFSFPLLYTKPYYLSYGLSSDSDPSARGWSRNVLQNSNGGIIFYGGLFDDTTSLFLFYSGPSGLFLRNKLSK